MPAFIARATTGVSGAASNGEIRIRSTFWVMKLSICEVWVLTLPAPSAICKRELRNLRRGRRQFVVDVLAIGLGVVGLREADHVLAVLAAVLDERRGLGRAGEQAPARRRRRPGALAFDIEDP